MSNKEKVIKTKIKIKIEVLEKSSILLIRTE